jgi:hypothetical protein
MNPQGARRLSSRKLTSAEYPRQLVDG